MKVTHLAKQFLALSVIGLSLLSLSACNEKKVIVIIGNESITASQKVIIQESGRVREGRIIGVCSTEKIRETNQYRNRRGEIVREDSYFSYKEGCMNASSEAIKTPRADFAKTFGMSFDAADRLLNAFETAQAGDSQKLLELGLTPQDWANMAQYYQMPSAEGINALSTTLDQYPEDTTAMVNRILKTIRENREVTLQADHSYNI